MSLLPFSLLCCCFFIKNIVYLITNLFYSPVWDFRRKMLFFLAHICLVSTFLQTNTWPGLSWENTISQLASRESSQHSVDVWVGTLSQRCSPAHSALPVAVTVKKKIILTAVQRWSVSCKVVANGLRIALMSVPVLPVHQGLYTSIVKPPTNFWGSVQHSQSLLKWVCDNLEYQTNCFAINLWTSEAKFRYWGCCNLICAIKEAGRHRGMNPIPGWEPQSGHFDLRGLLSSPLIVQQEPRACSAALLFSKHLL